MDGTHFWSGEANHCAIPGCESASVTVTLPVTVTVENGEGTPLADVAVYAFDGTSYSGYHGTTGASGQVDFTLPQGSYRFRADHDGGQYWSGEANHCDIPGCTAVTIVAGETPTPEPTATPTPSETPAASATPTLA